MMTESQQDVANIGVTAGMIWHYLHVHGPVTLSKLSKELEIPRDTVMQGVGWLAREGKIRFDETPRSKVIALT
jgi:predicted ArsR family transcriptional regulator